MLREIFFKSIDKQFNNVRKTVQEQNELNKKIENIKTNKQLIGAEEYNN